MTSPTTALERLEPYLQTAETLAADTLTTAGIPASYAPLALILGGLAALLWLLSTTGGGSTREGLRPTTPDTTAGRRATGGTPAPRSLRSKGAVGDTTTGGHHDTTGRAGGGRRKDTDDDGADWAAEEVAILEHSGGKEPPPRGWLVPDLVPHGPVPVWHWYWRRPTRQRPLIDREVKGYTTVVLGSGGVGKSYLDVDLGTAALTGGTWLGKPVQRVKNALYVDCELDAQTFWTRAFAVARGRWLEGGKPPKGLHYLRLKASLASWAGQQQVRDAVRKSKADLILVDSLTIGAHGLALADSNGWRRVYAGFERWGKPVVAIDHLGKEAGRGAVGSFMKQAMVRSALTMERERGGNIKVEHSKTNFGPQVEAFRVVSSFTGGTSKDDPLTVSFTAAESGEPTPGRPSPSGVQRRLLTAATAGAPAERTPSAPPHSLAPRPLTVSFTAAEQTGASLAGGTAKAVGVDRPVAATAGTEKHPTVSAKGAPLVRPVLPVEQSAPQIAHGPTPHPLPVLTPRGKEVRAYTAPPGVARTTEVGAGTGPAHLGTAGAPPTTSESDSPPSARTHSVTPPILPPRESNAVVSREARPAGALPLNHGAHGDATQSLAPLPLPVLTPPAAPSDTTSSTILEWLTRHDPATPIPSRDIYAAMGAQGMTLRTCKVQLKQLYEAGAVERSGSQSKGYRYWVPGSTPTP